MVEIKPIEVKKAVKHPTHEASGVFIILVLAIIAVLGATYLLNLVNEFLFLLGMVVILLIISTRMPPFILELKEYERAVVLRFGKFRKVVGPGLVFLAPFIDVPVLTELRIITIDKELRPQQVITKDNIRLIIDAIAYIKISDPKAAVINIKDPVHAVVVYLEAHVRDIIGKMEMTSVISKVDVINEMLSEGLREISKDWGIEVIKVEIQSIELPPDVLEAMHLRKAAEQKKFAAAERARAHAIRIRAIQEAAGELTDPALQYLYFQALKKVAEGKSSKILFPIELTHLAERLSTRLTPVQKKIVEEDLKEKYKEFIQEEAIEGRPLSTEEILKELKEKAKKK